MELQKTESSAPSSDGYDIIGDVHGCANTLVKLLEKLGYGESEGVYSHPSRTAIFVGDILDRGPRIREALRLVKRMVEAGSAHCVMGNHEYAALAYTTELPASDSLKSEKQFVRAHNKRHNKQIAETLEQFAAYPDEWREGLDWIRRLPLFLELDGVRIVHACWDDELVRQMKSKFGGAQIDSDFIVASAERNSLEARIVDRFTRGTGLRLPEGRFISGRDGYQRRFFRTKFWAHEPIHFKDVVFQPDPLPEDLLDHPLDMDQKESLLSYGEHEPPVFVGHYWLQGKPKPIKKNIACLDYSAVKYGRLVAYRYSGEKTLTENNFEWVYVDPDD